MYTLYQFGTTTLPTYNTDYDIGVAPAQLMFIQTANGVFDGNGDGRSRATFPFSLSYKAVVAEDAYANNRTTLDNLRKLVGTRAFLYRYVDNANTTIHRCTARLVAMPQSRPFEQRGYFEITLEFQQLSPWIGTKNGTGWTFDSGILFDSGRNFDEGVSPTTLSLASTTLTVTNNGNIPATDSLITVKAGAEALESLTVWNFTTNCRFYWAGTLTPGSVLQIDTGACSVVNNGADDYNSFKLDDPFHRNEHWMEFAPGANSMAVVRFGGSNNSTISFVFSDTWA